MKQQRKWLYAIPLVCAAVFTAINPQPIYAIFGIGDVVFDPSSGSLLRRPERSESRLCEVLC